MLSSVGVASPARCDLVDRVARPVAVLAVGPARDEEALGGFSAPFAANADAAFVRVARVGEAPPPADNSAPLLRVTLMRKIYSIGK